MDSAVGGRASESGGSGGDRFDLTPWTVILAARDERSPGAAAALERFARRYWRPVCAFLRRQGYREHDAQDLTQDFFCYFQEQRLLGRIRERQGRFRSFLLTCLKHFLSDQRDRARALKRGGGVEVVSLEAGGGDGAPVDPAGSGLTPDQEFDRQWAREVMDRCLERLREEYGAAGKAALYDVLKDLEPAERTEEGYAGVAVRLGMSAGALKSAVLRLRRRHAAILRSEISLTVVGTGEVEAELRHLIAALGPGSV